MSNLNYSGIISAINTSTINAQSIFSPNFECNNLTCNNNPGVGETLIGVLPASYLTNPFPTTTILLVDLNGNYIALPTAANCYLRTTFIRINNLGPGAGGTWATGGTAEISIGTSPITPPALSNLINTGQTPWNLPFPINNTNGFATGTNNFTGSFSCGHNQIVTSASTLFSITSATVGNNYLSVLFQALGGTITPGTANALGSLSIYLSVNYL